MIMPVLLGYQQQRLGTSDGEFTEGTATLERYAQVAGYCLAEVYSDRNADRPMIGMIQLIHAVAFRQDVKAIAVPRARDLGGNPHAQRRMLRWLQHETGVPVMVLLGWEPSAGGGMSRWRDGLREAVHRMLRGPSPVVPVSPGRAVFRAAEVDPVQLTATLREVGRRAEKGLLWQTTPGELSELAVVDRQIAVLEREFMDMGSPHDHDVVTGEYLDRVSLEVVTQSGRAVPVVVLVNGGQVEVSCDGDLLGTVARDQLRAWVRALPVRALAFGLVLFTADDIDAQIVLSVPGVCLGAVSAGSCPAGGAAVNLTERSADRAFRIKVDLSYGTTEIVLVLGQEQMHLWHELSWCASFGREVIRIWLRAPWGDGDLIARRSGLCLMPSESGTRVAVVVRDLSGTYLLPVDLVEQLRTWAGTG